MINISHSKTKKSIGQTLVEILATVLILGIGVIGLMRFQNYLTYDNLLNKQQGEATTLALNKIESLRDYHVINNTSGYTSYQSIASGSSSSTIGNTTYALSWQITSFTNPTYKTINVTVTWIDRNSVSQSIQLTTIVSGVDPANSVIIM